MEREEIQKIIFSAIDAMNQARLDEERICISHESVLFGKNGVLKSMELVALIGDIEDGLMEKNIFVILNDERAMSQTRNPFRDVSSLTEYIAKLISDQ